MGKNKNLKKLKRSLEKEKSRHRRRFDLSQEAKQWIWGIVMLLLAVLISLSFFEQAGPAGSYFMRLARFLIGRAVFLMPLILTLGGLAFLRGRNIVMPPNLSRRVFWPVILAVLILILGGTGIMGIFNIEKRAGGLAGYITAKPLLGYFGFWASFFIMTALSLIGAVILWQYLRPAGPDKIKDKSGAEKEKPEEMFQEKPSLIKKIFAPKLKIKEVPSSEATEAGREEKAQGPIKAQPFPAGAKMSLYKPLSLDLLDKETGAPTSGDIKVNSAIIKKTFQNFGIDVEMSEINIGPTVTQYTLKPAEGVKLAKITNLSNDLALSLASHPIRIEAPIPGRPLVGIEVPNKGRAQVKLRNLLESENFQKSPANLLLALGKDVSGTPVYVDLTKMPHLLVAGSTGTGKTIFLNSLILSLLYQPSTPFKSGGPDFLRLILVDPKRVEFPVYNALPHLLCPVIYSATQTISAIKWLIAEMERRFDVLSEAKARDIGSFNAQSVKGETDPLPFIVFIIDELADLMAAKGREIESGIVRLAQMARAVGIHLVVATQRPSVEVITGLIKANITSRVTFQVASQVDSRTVLDTSGAEKLLGAGDMLYLSSQVPKPKRIQAAHIVDKEVRRVINYINTETKKAGSGSQMDEGLVAELQKNQDRSFREPGPDEEGDDDLYDEAKRLVYEAKKASASLLQRRLRIGYARAARLIDILEEKGVVSPGDGAKPREVYGIESEEPGMTEVSGDEEEWKKV